MNNSSLFDETTFYKQFISDLLRSTSEVVIESPFITTERMKVLLPIFRILLKKNVKIYIFTRDPKEHSDGYELQSEAAIQTCEAMGIQVFVCLGYHHRKLAILDRSVLWEGSLNILSQMKSREIMRRIDDSSSAREMFRFLQFQKFI